MPVIKHGEHPGKAVHPQGERKAEIRNPLCRETDDAAPDDLRVTRQHQDQADKSDCGQPNTLLRCGRSPEKAPRYSFRQREARR